MADSIPDFSTLIRGLTVPVVTPKVHGDRNNQTSGIAVSRVHLDGATRTSITLRHRNGTTLTALLDDEQMTTFCGLLLQGAREQVDAAGITSGVAH